MICDKSVGTLLDWKKYYIKITKGCKVLRFFALNSHRTQYGIALVTKVEQSRKYSTYVYWKPPVDFLYETEEANVWFIMNRLQKEES